MAESFRDESLFSEKDHETDGSIEVFYNDGASIYLHKALIKPTSYIIDGEKLRYDLLVDSDGHTLAPYSIVEDETLLMVGNTLEETISRDGMFGLHSKRHILDLGFLAIVADQPGAERLEIDMQDRFWDDSNNYPLDIRRLTDDEGYDLWIRLEARRLFRGIPQQTVMARLAYVGVGESDKVTMVPFIKTFDGSQVAATPQQLTLGDPWLYVGLSDYDLEPEEG